MYTPDIHILRMNQTSEMKILEKIVSLKNTFSPKEQRIAEYILECEDIIYKTITEVTEESDAGYGTFIRFCKKLGFNGFYDFKIQLAYEATPYDRNAATETGFSEILAKTISQLESTISNIDRSNLNRVAKAILESDMILVIGLAGSFPTVMELTYKLQRLGLRAHAQSDGIVQAISATNLSKNDMIIAVSFSGTSKDVINAAQIAVESRVPILTITNHIRSPLADMSDYLLITIILEQAFEAEIASRIPFHILIEILCDEIIRLKPEVREMIKRTAYSVSNKRL